MSQKEQLTPPEQRDRFARAVETVHHYLAAGNFIGAYVVAFSILEDRITAMYMTCRQREEGRANQTDTQRHQRLAKKMSLLVNQGVITVATRDHWLTIANERNRKLHDAMWNLDEFHADDVERVMEAARQASNLRKAQKRARAKQQK